MYYWRRRPPRPLASFFSRPHLFLSLKTTSRATARRLAVQLDLILEDAAMLAERDTLDLSSSQIETMLRAVVTNHLGKLERVAFAAKRNPDFDVQQARLDDKKAFWTYALLDAQGPGAYLRREEYDQMVADGFSASDINDVWEHLCLLRKNGLVPTKPHVLQRLLEDVEAVPTAMNFDIAQGIYYRGLKLALASVDRRYGGNRVEDAGFVDRMVLAQSDPPVPPPAVAVVSDNDPPHDPPKQETLLARTRLPMASFEDFTEKLIAANAKQEHWDGKTQRQVRNISKLFVKFMLQDQHVEDLHSVNKAHVAAFVDFLNLDIYVNYGKSSVDEGRSIGELRAVALTHDKSKRGITGDTLNRHLGNLGQVFNFAAARGATALAGIDLAKLRAKGKKGRARNARAKLPLEKAAAIFHAPVFNNCAAWDALDKPGLDGQSLVFHCALYFVPMLIFYTGCRREELCGLMVDDVVIDNGDIPYLHIAKNEQRRIKNAQSQRNIPLHPDVLRLNFLAYVEAIKALGYRLLFPDLFSPSTSSPMGDRFYKDFKPVLEAAGVTEKGLGAHAVRHLFGAQLKKKLVAKEGRSDLLGHGGDGETDERYCEPHEIATLLQFVMMLPEVTAHLQPDAVRLLPWVIKKEVAPFSQPTRAKRSARNSGVAG